MSQTVVLVTFYSRSGTTERLATAAAVGAVQARAGIRMRRLAEADLEGTLAQHRTSTDAIQRMRKEYVAPKEADVLAADALIVGLPDDVSASSPECTPYVEILTKLEREGKLSGKAAAVVGTGPAPDDLARVFRELGLTVVRAEEGVAADEVEQAVALGRRVVSTAESLRERVQASS